MSYDLNDEFESFGIKIRGLFSDNNYYELYNTPTYTYDFSMSGAQLVTVNYQGKTTTLTVTVNEQIRDDKEYEINSLLVKYTYDSGYVFETKILKKSQAIYSDYIVVFYYDAENRFLGLNYLYTKLEYNESSRIGFFVPNPYGNVHKVKVTVLNSLAMLTPLVSAKEIIIS